MTGKDLLQAINYLEDKMVEQSLNTPNKAQGKDVTAVHNRNNRKSVLAKTALKWGAAAAAALLFFGGGVAYAAKYGIIRTNPGWESGYHVDITSRRVSEAEFSEELRAVKQELLKDIAAAEDLENTSVFGWIQDFNTVEETIAFIDHQGLKSPDFPGTLEQTGGGIKDDGLQYADEIYITANGKEAFLIYPTEYTGNHGIQAYLVEDSVIYELWVSGYDKDTDRIVQLMKEWLDKF